MTEQNLPFIDPTAGQGRKRVPAAPRPAETEPYVTPVDSLRLRKVSFVRDGTPRIMAISSIAAWLGP